MTRLIAATALLLLAAGLVVAAYGLRYVPIGGSGFNEVTLWDRLERRVCVVTMLRAGDRLDCSLEDVKR